MVQEATVLDTLPTQSLQFVTNEKLNGRAE